MAQAGYTPIQLYYSSTTTNAPTAGNLASGELAINITDGKLFYKDNGGSVQVIAWKTTPTTAGGTGLTSWTAGDLPYYATGTTLSKLGIGTNGQILTSTGTAPQWSTLSGVAVTTFSAGTTGFTPSTATSGAVTLAGTLATTNGGTGLTSFTANGVVYASSSSALTTGSALTFDGNQLAIGAYVNSGLGEKLTINGNGLVTQLSNQTNRSVFGSFGGSTTIIGSFDALPLEFRYNNTEGMRLTSTGLGIGTSSPGAKLDVQAATGTFKLTSTTGTNIVYSQISNTGGDLYIGRDSSAGSAFYSGSPAYGSVFMSTGAYAMAFATNSLERIRITSAGDVGIGTSSPSQKLHVYGNTNGPFETLIENANTGNNTYAALEIKTADAGSGYFILKDPGYINSLVAGRAMLYGTASGVVIANGGSTGPIIFSNGELTELARFDSSGNLGIGTSSPTNKLDVSTDAVIRAGTGGTPSTGGALWLTTGTSTGGVRSAGIRAVSTGTSNAHSLVFLTNADSAAPTEVMRLDSSGNLGLGVTPSAWGLRAIDIGTGAGIGGTSGGIYVAQNAYYTTQWVYKLSAAASLYSPESGSHKWYVAPSGTAGNAISFTQAMTLDASGNLLVGKTGGSGARLEVSGSASGAYISNLVENTNAGGYTSTNYSVGTAGASGTASINYAPGIFFAIGPTSNDTTTPIVFRNNNATERARITSGGDLLVGTTSNANSARLLVLANVANYSARIQNDNASPNGATLTFNSASPNGTGNEFLYCNDSTALRASIRSNGGLANYSANDVNLSDRREKTNFAPAKSYLDTICAIPVQTFNYIDQSEDDPGLTLGVVAQDVQAVAPELVMESNWGSREEPKMRLSIYQTDLQYALMKCIQELKAELDTVKAELATLKGN